MSPILLYLSCLFGVAFTQSITVNETDATQVALGGGAGSFYGMGNPSKTERSGALSGYTHLPNPEKWDNYWGAWWVHYLVVMLDNPRPAEERDQGCYNFGQDPCTNSTAMGNSHGFASWKFKGYMTQLLAFKY